MSTPRSPTPPNCPRPAPAALHRHRRGGGGALLVTVVLLPAEYGVDPTRVGSLLGLTEMGRIKMKLAEEASAEAQREFCACPGIRPAPATPTLPAPLAGMTLPRRRRDDHVRAHAR